MQSGPSAHIRFKIDRAEVPFQFTLKQVLALLISIAILLGCGRHGVWPVLALWIPSTFFLWYLTSGESRYCWGCWCLALPTWGVLAWLVSIRTPIEGTWLSLAGFALWGLWIAIRLPWRWGWILQLLLAWQLLDDLVLGHLPVPCCLVGEIRICDVQAGRTRMSAGEALTFAMPGPATAVIEKYLAPTASVWRASRTEMDAGFGGPDETEEYWNEASDRFEDLILSEWDIDWEKCLAMLPHDEARRQVLAAIACDGSLVRVEQLQLIARLGHHGYPTGHDAESWWKAHAWVFVPERDATAARAKTRGWRTWMTRAYSPWYRQKMELPERPMGIDWWPPIPIPTEEELSVQ